MNSLKKITYVCHVRLRICIYADKWSASVQWTQLAVLNMLACTFSSFPPAISPSHTWHEIDSLPPPLVVSSDVSRRAPQPKFRSSLWSVAFDEHAAVVSSALAHSSWANLRHGSVRWAAGRYWQGKRVASYSFSACPGNMLTAHWWVCVLPEDSH